MQKQVILTAQGLKQITDELEDLKSLKREEVAEKIKQARSFGDLSENSEYDEAKNEQAEIETKIAQLEETIKNATVLDDTQLKTDKVSVGNKVRIYNVLDDAEQEFSIVGSTEADPFANKISDDSPLGKALIGSREGDTITVEAPVGILKYTIIEIAK
mgnify:CR=1 FL=1